MSLLMSNNTCPMQMLWFVFLSYSAEMRSEANAVQEHPFDRTLYYVQYIKRYFCTRPEKVCRPIYIIFYYSFRVFCTALALLIFPFCTACMIYVQKFYFFGDIDLLTYCQAINTQSHNENFTGRFLSATQRWCLVEERILFCLYYFLQRSDWPRLIRKSQFLTLNIE